MIEFTAVAKRYALGPAPGRPPRVVDALLDVDLAIDSGVWGVVGPNGAGKTTLFAILLGFVFPSSGDIRIQGLAPRDYCRRHGAGYLPERFQLPGEWTVQATLRTLARLDGARGEAADERTRSVLERLGLADHFTKPLAALSRGLLQRVGIAQALLGRHELVVFDEPTEGLDPLWRIRFRAIVEELRAEGRTVLMARHDLAEVERLASRVVLLEDGRVRDVLELEARGRADSRSRYRLQLAAACAAVAEVFPGAAPAGNEHGYVVEASDAAELSARLAALLAAGATIAAVEPLAEPLEERVRRVLGESGAVRP